MLQNSGDFDVFTNSYYQLLNCSGATQPLSIFNINIPEGKYNYIQFSAIASSDPSKKVSLFVNAETRRYYNGNLTSISENFTIAPIPRISVKGSFANNKYRNPGVNMELGSNQLITLSRRFALNPIVQLIGF